MPTGFEKTALPRRDEETGSNKGWKAQTKPGIKSNITREVQMFT